MENLRKSREKFLNRFRNSSGEKDITLNSFVKDVMTKEWQSLRKDHSHLPTCSELLFPSDDEEIKYLNSIIDEIQISLKAEGNVSSGFGFSIYLLMCSFIFCIKIQNEHMDWVLTDRIFDII